MFGSQPLEDPLGRVPLLPGPLLVFLQYGVDDTLPGRQLRPSDRLLPPIPRRQRILQHLAYCLPRQPELPAPPPRALPPKKPPPPHPRIDLHGVHTSGVPRRKAPLTASEPCSLPLIGSDVRGTRMWRWTTFIRHVTSLTRRNVVYFSSGAYSSADSHPGVRPTRCLIHRSCILDRRPHHPRRLSRRQEDHCI